MLDLLTSSDPQFSIPVRIINQTAPPSLFFTTVLPSLLSFLVGVVASAITKPLSEIAWEKWRVWECKRLLFSEFADAYAWFIVLTRTENLIKFGIQGLSDDKQSFPFPHYQRYKEHHGELLRRVDPLGTLEDFVSFLQPSFKRTELFYDALELPRPQREAFPDLVKACQLTERQKTNVTKLFNSIATPLDFRARNLPFDFTTFFRRMYKETIKYKRFYELVIERLR
jgi:hypothetical protein